MDRVKVKICGLTQEGDVKSSVEAGADLLGFIVHTPRLLETSPWIRLGGS